MNNVATSRPINPGVPVHALSPVRELSPSASRGQGRPRSAGAAPLPLEIGFLAAHGVRPDRLRYAAMVAILAGVSPGEAALALGLVSEEAYYRALAAELGLPFVRHPRVSGLARFPHSLTVGLAPAPGRGFVTAPPAREIGRLLAVRRRLGGPVAVTTPSGLRAAVFAAAGPRIADLAAHDLPRQRSALSYRDGTTLAQIALAALASAGSSAGSQHRAPPWTQRKPAAPSHSSKTKRQLSAHARIGYSLPAPNPASPPGTSGSFATRSPGQGCQCSEPI